MRSLPGSAPKESSPAVPVSSDFDVDAHEIRVGATGAGRLHRQRFGAEEIAVAVVDQVVGRIERAEREADLRRGAGERHRAGPAAGHARAVAGEDLQRAVQHRERGGENLAVIAEHGKAVDAAVGVGFDAQ